MKYLTIIGMLICLSAFAKFDHSHGRWNEILKQSSLKKGHQVYFHYRKLLKDKEKFNAYLNELESLKKSSFDKFSQKQKLAFWINAYNAYTVQLILKHYPVGSIKDINSGLFSSGPWKQEFIRLFGKMMSLDNIEHDIIRKEFSEPRIHFALNCASIGCPSLLQEAFIGKKLEEQLEKAAQNFLNNKSKNFLKGETLHISKIFKWYGEDFDEKFGGPAKYVIKSLGLPSKKYKVVFNKYDWSLNELK